MTALLIIAVLVALYIAWRVYSQMEIERKERAIARSIQALPKESDATKPNETQPIRPPSDVFGEKLRDPFPLKTETLEEWLEKHPDLPSQQVAIEIREPEPNKPSGDCLAGKLLPPKPSHPLPPVLALPRVRKRKRNK